MHVGMLKPAGSWLTITPPTPLFFISVAFKRLSDPVNSLFATLTGGLISVDSKGVREGRKWKCENGKWQERGGASGALDGEGLGDIAMNPSSRQTAGSARWGIARGKGVADKGRRSFLRRAEGQGEYNAEGTSCQCLFSM